MENIEVIILIAVTLAIIFLVFKILKHVVMLCVLIYLIYAVGIVDSGMVEKYDKQWGVSSKLSEWNKELGLEGSISKFLDDSDVGGEYKDKAKCLTKKSPEEC